MEFVTIYFQNFLKHKGLYREEWYNTRIKIFIKNPQKPLAFLEEKR